MYGLHLILRLPANEWMQTRLNEWMLTTGLTDTSCRLAFICYFSSVLHTCVHNQEIHDEFEHASSQAGDNHYRHRKDPEITGMCAICLLLHNHTLATHSLFPLPTLPFATHSSLCCTLAFVLEDQSTLCRTWNLCHSFNVVHNIQLFATHITGFTG